MALYVSYDHRVFRYCLNCYLTTSQWLSTQHTIVLLIIGLQLNWNGYVVMACRTELTTAPERPQSNRNVPESTDRIHHLYPTHSPSPTPTPQSLRVSVFLCVGGRWWVLWRGKYYIPVGVGEHTSTMDTVIAVFCEWCCSDCSKIPAVIQRLCIMLAVVNIYSRKQTAYINSSGLSPDFCRVSDVLFL